MCRIFCEKFEMKSLRGGFLVQGIWWLIHDDVIQWMLFPRYWLFVRGIHRSPRGEFPSQRAGNADFDVSLMSVRLSC